MRDQHKICDYMYMQNICATRNNYTIPNTYINALMFLATHIKNCSYSSSLSSLSKRRPRSTSSVELMSKFMILASSAQVTWSRILSHIMDLSENESLALHNIMFDRICIWVVTMLQAHTQEYMMGCRRRGEVWRRVSVSITDCSGGSRL